MPFDWEEYLKVAKYLHSYATSERPNDEAICRSAISRAYYAAFCTARNYAAQRLDFRPTYMGEDHSQVLHRFQIRGMFVIARFLGELRTWRNRSDYDEELEKPKETALLALARAEEIVRRLKHRSQLNVVRR